jgi:hypothetical protein
MLHKIPPFFPFFSIIVSILQRVCRD